jgi:hypothetical protein
MSFNMISDEAVEVGIAIQMTSEANYKPVIIKATMPFLDFIDINKMFHSVK